MELNELYSSICLHEDGDTLEVLFEDESIIWGNAYDVVNWANELLGNVKHEYTSKYGSATLDSVLTVGNDSLQISASSEDGDNHEVIVGLSSLLKDHEVLFVTESNGNSDLAFIIDTRESIEENKNKYGYSFSINFIPVSELPNLWHTPGNKLDAAAENYAVAQSQ